MKFPVSVTAKKPSNKRSTNDENDMNRANMIYPADDTKTSLFNLQPSKLSESVSTKATKFTTTTNKNTANMVYVTRGPEVVHQPKQEAVSESAETVIDETAEAILKRRTSLTDEGIDCSVSSFDYDSEQMSTRFSSRSSSIYDDSGFNSSASDDKDDISESLMNVNYDCDCEDEIEENEVQDRTSYSVFNSLVESDRLGIVVEESSVDTSVDKQGNVNSSSEIDFTKELTLNTNSDSLLSKNRRSIDPSNNDVLVNNSVRNSRRQRTVQADPTPAVAPTARTRSRRHRTKDQNNNVSPCNLRSHLGKSPFRLVDGFQERGLLSLVACIIYTLVLVMVCGAFGVFVESFRSLVGKSELKEMRNSIIQSRNTRLPVSSG